MRHAKMHINAVVVLALQRLYIYATGSQVGGACTALTVRLYGIYRTLAVKWKSSVRSLVHTATDDEGAMSGSPCMAFTAHTH